MLDRHPVARDARIVRVLSRLADRLARREVALLPPVALPDQAAKVARPAGKQQIVDATIRLSGEGGIEPLTHRKIAAAAGLSVASTTYFYGSKEDIVVDAAQELQARTMDAVVHRRVPTSTMLSRITLNEKNEERAEIAALAAFSAAASRGDELSGLAASLRRLRGIDGARWLEARGGERIDRLDGMIWAAASTTLTQQALLRPAAERAKLLDECSEAWLVRLFG
jgi:AcrR family transcriptional regulator